MESEQKEPSMPAKNKVVPPFSGPLAAYEEWLYGLVYEKVPFKLPAKASEWIVKFGPWITLVVAALMLPALFTIFTISAYVGTVYSAYVAAAVGPMYYLAIAMLAVQVVVMFLSIAPLMKQRRLGWQLLFYSNTLNLVYSVFNSFSYGFNFGTLLSGLVGAAISYYFVFQIRSYYKS